MKNLFKILFVFSFFISITNTYGQGANCTDSAIFCSEMNIAPFPAGVNVPSLGSMGCLGLTRNPAWYQMQINQSGNLGIKMYSTPAYDLDFICWGPFDTQRGNCGSLQTTGGVNHGPLSGACPTSFGGYPLGNIVDCSYDPSPTEYIHIQNGIAGKWYILLVTNFSNQPCNIHLETVSCAGNYASTECYYLFDAPKGDTICEGETAHIVVDTILDGVGCTFLWDGPNDFSATTTNDTLFVPNTTMLSGGIYSLTVVTPIGSSTSSKQTSLLVNPRPNIQAATDTICLNETATLIASGAGVGGSYLWRNTLLNTDIGNTDTIHPTPIITDTNYRVIGTNMWGCIDSTTTSVIVASSPIVTVTPSVICSGAIATATSNELVSYSWNTGETTNTLSPTVLTQTQFSVIATNSANCTGTTTLTVNPNPIVEAIGDEICNGETGYVSASGATTYLWSNGLTSAVASVSPNSTTNYSVIGTNEYGCTGTASASIIVNPKPIANFTPNPTLVYIDSAQISFLNTSTGASMYNWDFGDAGVGFSNEQSPDYSYTTLGYHTVSLSVESEFGCKDSIRKQIQVKSPYFFYLPTAFSPDKDGNNEEFCPQGIGVDTKDYTMHIFSRWGELVYSSSTPYNCWDGMYNGIKALPGIYVYKINLRDFDGIQHEYQGQVMLIR